MNYSKLLPLSVLLLTVPTLGASVTRPLSHEDINAGATATTDGARNWGATLEGGILEGHPDGSWAADTHITLIQNDLSGRAGAAFKLTGGKGPGLGWIPTMKFTAATDRLDVLNLGIAFGDIRHILAITLSPYDPDLHDLADHGTGRVNLYYMTRVDKKDVFQLIGSGGLEYDGGHPVVSVDTSYTKDLGIKIFGGDLAVNPSFDFANDKTNIDKYSGTLNIFATLNFADGGPDKAKPNPVVPGVHGHRGD